MIDIEKKKRELDIHLSNAQQVLDELAKANQEATKQLRHLRTIKMRVVDIADFCGQDESTIHRNLNKGTLRSKKILDVIEYKQQKGL